MAAVSVFQGLTKELVLALVSTAGMPRRRSVALEGRLVGCLYRRKFKGQGWGDREKRRVREMRREEVGKFNSGEGLVLGMGGGYDGRLEGAYCTGMR